VDDLATRAAAKYDATVLGWAEFCGQPQVAQLVRERGGRA
jgi:hypothetical protein